MQHKILYRPSFAMAHVELAAGESIRTESGAMVGMSAHLRLESKLEGGLLASLGRAMLAGESLFQSTYTAEGAPGEILLAPATPGDILGVDLVNQTLLVQSGSWLAGSTSLSVETQFAGMQMLGGEGAFLIKVSGSGTLLLSSYGAIHKIVLAAGESYVVDSGHVVAFDIGVRHELTKAARGFLSSVTSGEGLVFRYTGPGEVYLQTRSLQSFVDAISPMLPKPAAPRG
ncbi:MAG: TIGR00266 family protein [Pseudomonadota bacterium]|nr:TIGR00266 family protein [Pseudomonadota bacterium]